MALAQQTRSHGNITLRLRLNAILFHDDPSNNTMPPYALVCFDNRIKHRRQRVFFRSTEVCKRVHGRDDSDGNHARTCVQPNECTKFVRIHTGNDGTSNIDLHFAGLELDLTSPYFSAL